MSRSGYSDDWDDNWACIMGRGAVISATRGKRGQAFFHDLLAALDAMPEKRLIADALEDQDGSVCALGALGKARGIDLAPLDPEDPRRVGEAFGIATALVREVVYENDEAGSYWQAEEPEARWQRVRAWVASQIKEPAPAMGESNV